jgi:hypothetical protein
MKGLGQACMTHVRILLPAQMLMANYDALAPAACTRHCQLLRRPNQDAVCEQHCRRLALRFRTLGHNRHSVT